MVLDYNGRQRLALWQTKLIMTEWAASDELALPLTGLDLDKVWENIVSQLTGVEVRAGSTLDEAIARAARREKLQKEIDKLEKKAWAEKQPRKKMEFMERIRSLKKEQEAFQ